jgi:predicted GNAT family N-acyltransferase
MEDYRTIYIKDDKLSENFKTQIEELNRVTFPENLIDGKYIFNQQINNPSRLIILLNNEIIAHLLTVERMVQIDQSILKIIYVGELMVRDSFRNRGIGKYLLKEFNEKKFDSDCALLLCEQTLVEFYKKNGWIKLNDFQIELGANINSSRIADSVCMVKYYTTNSKVLEQNGLKMFLGEPV